MKTAIIPRIIIVFIVFKSLGLVFSLGIPIIHKSHNNRQRYLNNNAHNPVIMPERTKILVSCLFSISGKLA